MSFEERLLMELKTEIAARAGRRRFSRGRLLAGVGLAGVAAAAAIAIPLLTGTAAPAYALTPNGDGSITLKINEFKNPDQVEKDLKGYGVTADVTYVKPGTRCGGERGDMLPPRTGDVGEWEKSVHFKAARPSQGTVIITPRYIGPGQTLVLEITQNDDQTSGPEKPRALWQFSGRLIQGPVKPCEVVEDPSWNDLGGPEGQPPAGS
ncbi:hypothetical protein [Nonomuraea sp. NPDC046570]|uniref:hypothetical protein n=1 Tax=Nonomuraea sp. NPDC046570 TaxID=3155255 RepID=UPI0034090F9B